VKRPLFVNDSQPSTPCKVSASPQRYHNHGEEKNGESMMVTPLKKKSGSMHEARSATKRDDQPRSQSLGSAPSSPFPSRMLEGVAIHSPDFNVVDEDDYGSTSPLPLRDVSSVLGNNPIADLSPIAPSLPLPTSEEAEMLRLSDNPSPLATRTIEPFPTFTIEEASIEGDSPEKPPAHQAFSASSAPSDDASPSLDFESAECLQALTTSNHNNAPSPCSASSASFTPSISESLTPATATTPVADSPAAVIAPVVAPAPSVVSPAPVEAAARAVQPERVCVRAFVYGCIQKKV